MIQDGGDAPEVNRQAADTGAIDVVPGNTRETGERRRIRALVTQADPDVVEEWKWRGVLEGNTRRAIDFHEGDTVDEKAFQALVHAAVALNTA